jgi:hypothetical protein
METLCSSETLVSTYKSTRRQNPEDQQHHRHRRENLTPQSNARRLKVKPRSQEADTVVEVITGCISSP